MSGAENPSTSWLRALEALNSAVSALDTRAAVIGGIAVALQARPRYTEDLDAVLLQRDIGVTEAFSALLEAGFVSRLKDPLSFARQNRVFCLSHTETEFQVDVSLGALSFEVEMIENADEVDIEGVRVRLARIQDLLVLKFLAGRPQDFIDVDWLLEADPNLDRDYVRKHVKQLARDLGAPEKFERADQILSR